MGNWSINPHELASIDDNGKATFQKHTKDVEYTITYDDNVTGASTKKFMVYGCGVDCSVYDFNTSTSIIDPMSGNVPIAHSSHLNNLEQLSYTIKDSGGFLTGITAYTIYEDERLWEYRGYFNTTTSSSDRTAIIEYKNGDGTCVFPQELVMKGKMDCFLGGPDSIEVPSDITDVIIGFTSNCDGEFVPIEVVDQGTLEDVVIIHTSGVDGKITFKYNGSTSTWLKVKQINGTGTLSTIVSRYVPPQPSASINTNLIISSASSGSLRVTGSTYTAEFSLAYNTGTLHGTLTADTRDKMTFKGEWDGSPGATIYNSCPGSAPQGLYTIGDAHWDLSTKTLYVNLSQCTP